MQRVPSIPKLSYSSSTAQIFTHAQDSE